jgi:hypothetical protein
MINTKLLIAGALLAGFMSSNALAQSTAPAKAPTATEGAVKLPNPHWRASKLIGVKIYNEQNERLGDINEIIMDQTGKTLGYVIGVGGFLGMGEHDIFVEPSKVKFVNEPVRTAAAPAANDAPTNKDNKMTTRPASSTQARDVTEIWYPDHGLLSATKEQLKAMPQFKYSNYN